MEEEEYGCGAEGLDCGHFYFFASGSIQLFGGWFPGVGVELRGSNVYIRLPSDVKCIIGDSDKIK